jgi:ADP-ribosyl-[dinitrogen reductase] hydrolase
MIPNPNPLMLLRIAQGDAYGMATEYIKFPRDQQVHDAALKFERYVKHPTHNLNAGQYTDDTQMSIAVSEVLLKLPPNYENPRLRETPGAEAELQGTFIESFIRCFKRDERDGYSRGFQAFLEGVEDGADFVTRIENDSDKNGAAMRSVPIGVLPDPSTVVDVAAIQAKTTHNTVGGIQASILVAMMSHFALYRSESFKVFPEWLDQYTSAVLLTHDGPVVGPGVGIKTAHAVFTLLSTEKTLLGIARKVIEWGGDTDSVLSIAWGIASARMSEELPAFFEGGLEDGTYGRNFLRDLGTKLMQAYTL